MVQGTSSKMARLECLYDVTLSGAQNASATGIKIGAETNTNRVINRGEWAEIKWLEIISPLVAATGVGDNVAALRPYIDGNNHRGNDKVILRCDLDNLVAYPPTSQNGENQAGGHIFMRQFVPLGMTLPELIELGVERNPQLLLKNTTLKTKEAGSINFQVDIDTGGTTGNIEVRAWGVRYTDPELLDGMIQRVYGSGEGKRIQLLDPLSNRDFSFTLNPKNLGSKYFDTLLGGNNQALAGGVEVDRFHRWSRNNNATTVNQEYDMSFSNGTNVLDTDKALSDPFSFKNGIPKDYLVMYDGIGLNPHANHSEIRIQTNQQYVFKDLLSAGINHLEFGRSTAVGPAVTFANHQFRPIPRIKPIFASGEQLKFMIVDTGTQIPAGTTFGAGDLICATGLLVRSPEYEGLKPKPLGGN